MEDVPLLDSKNMKINLLDPLLFTTEKQVSLQTRLWLKTIASE
jgi:hypothetical protein